MKWILGIDLRPLSAGAIRFCNWLRATSRSPQTVVAVHVLEEPHMLVVLRYRHLPEVLDDARASVRSTLAREGLTGDAVEEELLQATSAEEGLESARLQHGADGVVIGRAAGRSGQGIVRLGRVARRILRSAAGPVVVVPPDLELRHLGGGPIVALTRLQPDSVEACRFAASIAERLGRGLALIHVVPLPVDFGLAGLPTASLDSIRGEAIEDADRRLAEWTSAQRFKPVIRVVLEGPLVEVVLDFVEREAAPLIVCGSRRLSTLERTLVHSTGTELAAGAPVPVAMVPPRMES
jgi:nucleotide-binding universal stress UspA family protein